MFPVVKNCYCASDYDSGDCKWVTTSDYKWLKVRLQVTTSHTTKDYEWLRVKREVTTSD